jgi:hypothetical protein
VPTDLTGTPTSLGIGTYNTSGDAPSGLGFNAAMAQIDALIAGRALKPSGIVSGEVPVWNGTTWVRSSVTNVGPSSLGSGTPDVSKILHGDGSWSGLAAYRRVPVFVSNTTAATDLFSSFTLPANALSNAIGHLRLTLWGNYQNNTGAGQTSNRFQLVVGGTTIIDTGVAGGTALGTNAAILPWRMNIDIMNNNATNSQYVGLDFLSTTVISSQFAWTPSTGSGVTYNEPSSGGYAFLKSLIYNTGAKDMTAAQTIALNVIQPVASVNFTTTLMGATIEVL